MENTEAIFRNIFSLSSSYVFGKHLSSLFLLFPRFTINNTITPSRAKAQKSNNQEEEILEKKTLILGQDRTGHEKKFFSPLYTNQNRCMHENITFSENIDSMDTILFVHLSNYTRLL